MRFGFWRGLPWGLDAANLRHAHSHLMYFSWATPAIIALWLAAREQSTSFGREQSPSFAAGAGWAALILGAAAYPFFLAAGYGPLPVFGRSLPMASILSGLNTFAWYAFGAWHFLAHRGVLRTPPLRLMDLSVAGLWLSTAGAWGRAAMQFAGAGDERLGDLAVHLFLGAFSHGWLLLSGLALALEAAGHKSAGKASPTAKGEDAAAVLLALGLAGSSLAGVIGTAALDAPRGAVLLLGASTLAFVAGAAWHGWLLARFAAAARRWEWIPYLAGLALTLAMLAGTAYPPLARWGAGAGLRIFYLHALALGAASTGLMTAAYERWGRRAAASPWAFGAAVLLLLAGVASLSPLWRAADSPAARAFAAYTSLAPLLPVAHLAVRRLSAPPGRAR